MTDQQKIILYAEDSPEDFWFLTRSFRKASITHPLYQVENGRDAVAYLKGEGQYADRSRFPLPDVLILDIKLPFMTGLEVLEWVRSQPEYFELPVVMLSSSDLERDRQCAEQLRANWYFIKPFTLLDYEKLARQLDQAWSSKS